MRIAVLLKPLRANLDSDARLEGLGPCDRAALDTALALAEQNTAARITVLTAGPEADEKPLLAAIGAGAHEAICAWGADLEERATHDVSLVPRLLAAALAQIGADLVLTGTHSGDQASGTTGPAVAHVLRLPHLTQVSEVEQIPQQMRIKATQRRVGGSISVILPLPALLAVSRGPNRKATLATASCASSIQRLTCEALGFDPDDAIGHPPPVAAQPTTKTATLMGSAEELAERIQALLR